MKLLLDSDVLLDVGLKREAFAPDSYRVLAWCHETPRAAVVAFHTVSNVYYILRAAQTDVAARKFVFDLLQFTEVAAAGTLAVRQALTLPMSDFEDALQVAAAMSEAAQWIVTRNVRDYRGSPVPAVEPRDFLVRVATR